MDNLPLLSRIHGPEDVKRLSDDELIALSTELRTVLIDSVLNTGGHLGSNLGIVELSIALLYVLDLDKDKLVYDVGHQSYAHKLLTDRYKNFDTLRSFGGLSGFQNPNESPYDFFQTGHASTSVSAVIGFARAARMRGEDGCFVAVTGDGALTGGMVYEALNDGGATDLPIVVIINDNEMSIDKNVGVFPAKLSKLRLKKSYIQAKGRYHKAMEVIPGGKALNRVFTAIKERVKRLLIPESLLDYLGFEFLGTVDGNDVQALIHAIRYAKEQNHPVLIHAKTEKGLGYLQSIEDPEKLHSVPRDNGGNKPATSSFSAEFGKTMLELGREEPLLAAVTAAMPGGTGLIPFREAYPERFIDVGIAEEHAVTMASALARGGCKPVVALYSTFLQRAFDQLLNDAALQKIPLTVAIDRSGLACDDGMTHNGIYDVGYLSMIPGMQLYAPSDYAELHDMLSYAVKQNALTAVRYHKGSEGEFTENTFTDKANVFTLREGNDITLVTYGMSVNKALNVASLLEEQGVNAEILKINRIIPLPTEEILPHIKKTGRTAVIEEVVKNGSVGEKLSSALSSSGIQAEFLAFHVHDVVPHGDRKSLEKMMGFDDETIAQTILEQMTWKKE